MPNRAMLSCNGYYYSINQADTTAIRPTFARDNVYSGISLLAGTSR